MLHYKICNCIFLDHCIIGILYHIDHKYYLKFIYKQSMDSLHHMCYCISNYFQYMKCKFISLNIISNLICISYIKILFINKLQKTIIHIIECIHLLDWTNFHNILNNFEDQDHYIPSMNYRTVYNIHNKDSFRVDNLTPINKNQCQN